MFPSSHTSSSATASPTAYSRAHVTRRSRANHARTGLTLVEMMIATTVAGAACLSAIAGLLTALRTADSNLRALQAHEAVRSVAERLQAIDYRTLYVTELPVDVPSRPNGALTVGEWNSRTDDFRNTPSQPADDLQFRVRPFVTRITHSTGADYAQIVIQYEWTDSSFFAPRTRSDAITMMVAPVSTF